MKKKDNWKMALYVIAIVAVLAITVKVFFFPKEIEAKEDVFKEKEYTIHLTDEFKKGELEAATYYYESDSSIVMVISEKASELMEIGIGEDSSLNDYMKAVVSNNNLPENVKINKKENYQYITYENGDKKTGQFYFMAVTFKQGDRFWLFNFACKQVDKKKFNDRFLKWTDSIIFK